jgi:Zn-dependent peptidase ImmA (M78 family)/predicted HTH domain antitoxin
VTRGAEQIGREAAEIVRRDMGLDDAPIADMVDVVEARKACDVAIEPMPPGMDGMVATNPDTGQSVIAVATTDLLHRQRFTLAHELGHLELGSLSDHLDVARRTAAEVQADAFARHLLAPLGGVRRVLDVPERNRASAGVDDRTHEDLSDVVRTFCVSPQVAAIQMRDAGCCGATEYKRLEGRWDARRLAVRFGWWPEYQSWVAEARQSRPPRRLLRRAMDGYVSGVVSLSAVASISGLSVDDLRAQLEAEGIRPAEPEIVWFDPDA